MTYFRVLVEGDADTPVVREVLSRKFGLQEETHFRIHPHKGIGKLPQNPLARPNPKHRGLLDQLPATLRSWSYFDDSVCVVVLLDVDDKQCRKLLNNLQRMLATLQKQRPPNVLFRLAIEETESWFIADTDAVKRAFPRARLDQLPDELDTIVGAAEKLAKALGFDRRITGRDKYHWAEKISPYLDKPRSPSFRKLIEGIGRNI